MKKQLRLSALLFVTQLLMYGIVTYNWRMIAQARTAEMIVSDLLYGSLQFFVISRVAKCDDAIIPWIGYALGGALGAWLGLIVSQHLVI